LIEYLRGIAEAADAFQGDQLGVSFNFSKMIPQHRSLLAMASSQANAQRLTSLTDQTLRNAKPFDQITALPLRGLAAYEEKNYGTAFKCQSDAADAFFDLVNVDKDSNWWLPALNSLIRTLRFISYQADHDREAKGEKSKHMIEAQDIAKRFFQRMIVDRSALNVSKKMGCLFLIVHLFKIYFRINNLRLCSNLVTIVKNPNFPKLDVFPPAQTVAYNFYLGRLMIFEEQYDKAEECLDFALAHCSSLHVANKRRILQFLIPVKLLVGKYPQPRLLQKYKLEQFESLIHAIRTGNLKSFNESLEKHQEYYIKRGTFLILEKLKTFVYRNLFRKVERYANPEYHGDAKSAAAATAGKQKRLLQLTALQAALAINDLKMDSDELECILANLVYQGYIKGYIAHKRCVVLSKNDPFPAASMSTLTG